MNIKLLLVAIGFIVFSSCQNSNQEHKQHNYPKQTGSINDFGLIFSFKEKYILDSLITNLKNRSNVELTLVSLDSTMTTTENFNSYTLQLANVWGINKKEKKKILIAISAPLQRVRINKGLAIQKELSGVHIREIMDVFMFPEFRKGNYFEGTRSGIEQIEKKLNK